MRSAFLLFRLSLKRARILLCVTGLLLTGFQALRVHIAASHSANDYEQIATLLPPSVRTILGPSVTSVLSFNGIVCGGYFDLGIVIALVAAGSIWANWRQRNPLKGLKPGVYQSPHGSTGDTLPLPTPPPKH